MEQDRNLLFGVLAVQLGKVSSSRLMQAAGAWAVDPAQSLRVRLVEDGALSAQDGDLIQRLVEEAILAHSGDARATLNSLGGEDRVLKTFGGTVRLTSDGVRPGTTPKPDQPPSQAQAPAAAPSEADTGVLETPGRYRFVSEQGKGGYGRVCLVHDSFMARDIAMKELIPPSDEPIGSRAATPSREAVEAVSRFLQEARITGQLEHPSIVPVYELGHRSDGTLYYTMKLVRGQTLSKELARRTTLGERLGLLSHFQDLCHAIAYAHDRGVIHRDIKPDNVMIGSFGETVVIDWGLAKLKGHADVYASEIKETRRILKDETPSPTSQTLYGTILGTPHFMSPEQARGDVEHIDERSDVYALGSVLYMLLTGKRPYDKAPLQNVILHMNLPPLTPIAELAPDAPPELITICMKALERQQDRRYPNAGAFAAEISRFTSGALVQSHQYTLRDQLRRFVRKYRAQVATAGAALATLLLVAVVSYVQVLQANTRERAQRIAAQNAEQYAVRKGKEEAEARAVAEQELYVSNIRLAYQSIERNQFDLARTLLAGCPPAYRNFEWGWLLHKCNADLATLRGHAATVNDVAVSAQGNVAASGDAKGTVILWDVESGAELRRATVMENAVHSLGFSPDGELLVVAGAQPKVLLCNVSTLQTMAELEGHTAAVNGAAFSPDGRYVATASSDDSARIWSSATRESVAELHEHLNDVVAVAWSPDQTYLVTGSLDNSAVVWDATTWGARVHLTSHRNDLTGVAISHDSARIATAGSDSTVTVWSAGTGASLATHTFEADVRDVAFTADGAHLAVALDSPVAYLLDSNDLTRPAFPIRGHAANIRSIAAAPQLLLTAGADNVVKIWHAPSYLGGPERAHTTIAGQEIHVVDRAYTKLAVASTEGSCSLYDVSSSAPLGRIDNLGHSGLGGRLWEFAGDSSFLLFTPDDNRPKVYNLVSRAQQELAISASPYYPAISPDDSTIAISFTSGNVEFFDAKTGQQTKSLTVTDPGSHLLPLFCRDATLLAIATMDREPAQITMMDIGAESANWTTPYSGRIASMTFTRDSSLLLVSGSNGLVVLDTSNGAVAESSLNNPLVSLNEIALSPDETRLAAEIEGGGILVFDAKTGREMLRFERPLTYPPASPIDFGDLFFSEDGRSLRIVTSEYQGRNTFLSLDTIPWSSDALPGQPDQSLEQRIDEYKRQHRAARQQEAMQWERAYHWLADEVSRSRIRFAGTAVPQQDLFADAAVKEWDISPTQWSMLLQMGRNRLKNLRDVHGYRGMEMSSDLVVDRSLAEFLAVLGFESNDIIVRINDTSTPGYDMFIEALELAEREGATQISVYLMRSGQAIVHRYYKTEPEPAKAAEPQ